MKKVLQSVSKWFHTQLEKNPSYKKVSIKLTFNLAAIQCIGVNRIEFLNVRYARYGIAANLFVLNLGENVTQTSIISLITGFIKQQTNLIQ